MLCTFNIVFLYIIILLIAADGDRRQTMWYIHIYYYIHTLIQVHQAIYIYINSHNIIDNNDVTSKLPILQLIHVPYL